MLAAAVKLGRARRHPAAVLAAAVAIALAVPAIGGGAPAQAATLNSLILPPPPGFPSAPPATPTNCPKETFPAANTPNVPGASGSSLYEIPFNGTLDGGMLYVPNGNDVVALILGPTYASLCGLLALPSLKGEVPKVSVDIANPIPVSLVIPGLTLSQAHVDLAANMTASITGAAPNGGLNLDLKASFQADLAGSLLSLPLPQLFDCGTAAGDLAETNYPSAELQTLEQQHPSYGWTNPIDFHTTGSVGNAIEGTVAGQPVTGAPTAGQTTLVSQSFPYPPALVGYGPNCTGLIGNTIVSAFNNPTLGLDLPAPPGRAFFFAPATFGIHVDPGG